MDWAGSEKLVYEGLRTCAGDICNSGGRWIVGQRIWVVDEEVPEVEGVRSGEGYGH